MAIARMGDLSDFYIYKSTLGGFDCFFSKSDEANEYRHFETAKEVLDFVELKLTDGYKISPNSLGRLKELANA